MRTRPQDIVRPTAAAFAAALAAAITIGILGGIATLFQSGPDSYVEIANAKRTCVRPQGSEQDPCYRVYVVETRRRNVAAAAPRTKE